MSPAPHLVLLSGTALTAHNGSSKVERALANELSRDFQVTLLTRDAALLPAAPFRHALYRRPSSKDWKCWLLRGRVGRVLEALDQQQPISLVHAFGFFPVGLFAETFTKSRKTPLVLTHHNMKLFPPGAFLRARTRVMLDRAAAITCLNAEQRDALAKAGVPPERLHLIPNGVSVEAMLPPSGKLPERFLLFAGRFEQDKGIHLLLDALEQLPEAQRLPLVAVGAGRDEQQVAKRLSRLGSMRLPWQPHEALLGLIARATAVVVPSYSEASPLLPLEAFALEVPVVLHDLPVFAEERRLNLADWVPLGDVASWSEALARAKERPDPARVARAKAFAQQRTWQEVAARYRSLYASLLQS